MSDGNWPSDRWAPLPAPGWGQTAAPPGWSQTPPPGWSPPPPGYGLPPKTNGLAIASLVSGLAMFMCWPIASIVAVVTGHRGRAQIRRSNGTEGGLGLTTAGLWLGYIGIALGVVGVGLFGVLLTFDDDLTRSELRDEAREFVARAEQRSGGGARDVDALVSAYYESDAALVGDTLEMYLATGLAIPSATIADWEAARWRVELKDEAVFDDVYVCVVVPRSVSEQVLVTNGRCSP